jgi:hypothetical protein
MTSVLVTCVAGVIRWWTRLYTSGLPFDQQEARRAEVESDLWESQEDTSLDQRSALSTAGEMAARLVMGLPDDLRWRYEQQPPRGRAVWLEMAAACALFLIVVLSSASMLSGQPALDLAQAIKVESVSTGWVYRRSAPQDRLVPFVGFELRNLSDRPLAGLYVSATFRQAGTRDEWGKGWTTAVGSWGLAPGAATRRLTLYLAAAHGQVEPTRVTGADAELADATVELFVRRASTPWTSLATYPVASQVVR